MNLWGEFTKGIVKENPIFRIVLGMCPTLAVTTAMDNGFWMGLAVIFVLTCSNIIIAAIRKLVPDKIRIPCYIVVIATFVTLVDMTMHAFIPAMYQILGIFIPLIAHHRSLLPAFGQGGILLSRLPLSNGNRCGSWGLPAWHRGFRDNGKSWTADSPQISLQEQETPERSSFP